MIKSSANKRGQISLNTAKRDGSGKGPVQLKGHVPYPGKLSVGSVGSGSVPAPFRKVKGGTSPAQGKF
jgi:hypothetical protein